MPKSSFLCLHSLQLLLLLSDVGKKACSCSPSKSPKSAPAALSAAEDKCERTRLHQTASQKRGNHQTHQILQTSPDFYVLKLTKILTFVDHNTRTSLLFRWSARSNTLSSVSDIKMFGYLDSWNLNVGIFGCLLFGCLDIWMFGYVYNWIYSCLDIWMFGYTWS